MKFLCSFQNFGANPVIPTLTWTKTGPQSHQLVGSVAISVHRGHKEKIGKVYDKNIGRYPHAFFSFCLQPKWIFCHNPWLDYWRCRQPANTRPMVYCFFLCNLWRWGPSSCNASPPCSAEHSSADFFLQTLNCQTHVDPELTPKQFINMGTIRSCSLPHTRTCLGDPLLVEWSFIYPGLTLQNANLQC